jgi:hypothetical protein
VIDSTTPVLEHRGPGGAGMTYKGETYKYPELRAEPEADGLGVPR